MILKFENFNESFSMPIKASMVIMSHLSDAQELISFENAHSLDANESINFAKFLILKYTNTDTEIDPDLEYKEFTEKHL